MEPSVVEFIATIMAVSRSAPKDDSLYLQGVALKCGSDAFAQVPNGIVDADSSGCFQVKLANTTKWPIILRAGELIGQLHRAKDVLKTLKDLAPPEHDEFVKHSACLAALVPMMDSLPKLSEGERVQDNTSEIPDVEHLGWGPKTTDPGPDQVYPSDKLKGSHRCGSLLESHATRSPF